MSLLTNAPLVAGIWQRNLALLVTNKEDTNEQTMTEWLLSALSSWPAKGETAFVGSNQKSVTAFFSKR